MLLDKPGEEPFEDELGEVLRRAGDFFEPMDRGELVDGAVARGRRRLARRRAAAVTGSVLALAAVGIGGAYGGGLLGASGDGESSVAAPTWSVTGGADGVVTDKDMIGILERLVPVGELIDTQARGTHERGGPSVSGVIDDGMGRAAVSVGLFRVSGAEATGQVTCPDKALVSYESCTGTTLADGSRLMIYQGYAYPDRPQDTRSRRAVLSTADGFLIDAHVYNAPMVRGSTPSRTDPPLDPQQLKELVTSDAWRRPLSQLPTTRPGEDRTGKEGGGAGIVSGWDVRNALVSLLPSGLKVSGEGYQEEYAYVVVDDGRGRSLVQINVQPGMSADVIFGEGATTLPDRTKLKTEKGPGEKGGKGVVMWTVDTVRPDGLRVVISAFNSGTQHGAATRETPALTMEQLTSIATSERWLSYS
ncbi:hypothetical protein ACFWM0_15230 [Streptomyces sp. NPDC058405]|uniref:hypothetical protein n=1 Tax=unclassified Streptomyces TaxID=2593676 RepID=UPI003648C97B